MFAHAQEVKPIINNRIRDTTTVRKPLSEEDMLDTLRKQQDKKKDTIIFTSKYIKVTNERLLNDSTQVFPLDTTLTGFENYSVLYQPHSPKIGIGNLGLSERDLLFEPSRTIGFDVGMHQLDAYLLHPQDIQYYRARTPFTSLYLVAGGLTEQVFRVIHTQNIKPNWNFGVNYNRIGSYGVYAHQHADHLGAAFFSWYESKDKRYNILGNLIFNNLKAPDNGSITNNAIYTANTGTVFDPSTATVRLNNSRTNWRDNGFYLKQFYYLGRIDSTSTGTSSAKVLPTQRVAYTFYYNTRKYKFLQDEADQYKVFPDTYFDQTTSRDSLSVTHFQNEFSYSFYLRGKTLSFVKNEAKLDLGLVHDYYNYSQYVRDTLATTGLPQLDRVQHNTFQDITLKARVSYRFSDKIGLNADFQQITLGRDFGDYLYDASINLSAGKTLGKIIIDAYTQNSTPPLLYTHWISNHFIWNNNFKNVKTSSASFNYINDKFQFNIKAEYFLINNYLYFASATSNGIDAYPMQVPAPINLIKISVGKNLQFGRWHFDNYGVYQKTDYQSTLRTPDLYIYSSLYYNKLFFDVLNTTIGVNVRYNTPYTAPSYATGIDQFYNGPAVKFSSYPVSTVYLKATLKRTNLFVMYDYANQGLLSQGYYTVNRYPMPNAILKYGVLWNFYD
ncbi:hypothetical protein BEL04_17190 [Mucilaginibacter sp. PPCGB 2223]|uniref:putative porin n=1 Tax=Mucilaginibacter sp. PPCGB 2223 TaxID=1886027 RepID=UPI0008242791|nr:putative porin [Mucilaginibacter sp. PPCGB 2223]OCX51747.1 hypothetical protein BEL04_17190 [Mucilaginibacter sp. PPCGB 2223]